MQFCGVLPFFPVELSSSKCLSQYLLRWFISPSNWRRGALYTAAIIPKNWPELFVSSDFVMSAWMFLPCSINSFSNHTRFIECPLVTVLQSRMDRVQICALNVGSMEESQMNWVQMCGFDGSWHTYYGDWAGPILDFQTFQFCIGIRLSSQLIPQSWSTEE